MMRSSSGRTSCGTSSWAKTTSTASHTGTDEIGLAVAATTFSIVAVFVPVAFMNGIAGQWFKPFALTIACAVLVSLFVSFSLDPMLSAYWPDPQLEDARAAQSGRASPVPVQHVVRSAGGRLQRVDRLGARPSLGHGGAGRLLVRRRHWPAAVDRRLRVHPGQRPLGVRHPGADAAGLESRLHADQAGGAGAHRAVAQGSGVHVLDGRRRGGVGRRGRGGPLRPAAFPRRSDDRARTRSPTSCATR